MFDYRTRTIGGLLTLEWVEAVPDSATDSTISTSPGDAAGEVTTGSMVLTLAWLERRFILVELTIHFFVEVLDDGVWGVVGGTRRRVFERVLADGSRDDCTGLERSDSESESLISVGAEGEVDMIAKIYQCPDPKMQNVRGVTNGFEKIV
jgi:hypothetical protein